MIPNAQEHEADQDCEADKTDPPPANSIAILMMIGSRVGLLSPKKENGKLLVTTVTEVSLPSRVPQIWRSERL